jgi:hypothetical protein
MVPTSTLKMKFLLMSKGMGVHDHANEVNKSLQFKCANVIMAPAWKQEKLSIPMSFRGQEGALITSGLRIMSPQY